jgi:hypothetical protein
VKVPNVGEGFAGSRVYQMKSFPMLTKVSDIWGVGELWGGVELGRWGVPAEEISFLRLYFDASCKSAMTSPPLRTRGTGSGR